MTQETDHLERAKKTLQKANTSEYVLRSIAHGLIALVERLDLLIDHRTSNGLEYGVLRMTDWDAGRGEP